MLKLVMFSTLNHGIEKLHTQHRSNIQKQFVLVLVQFGRKHAKKVKQQQLCAVSVGNLPETFLKMCLDISIRS